MANEFDTVPANAVKASGVEGLGDKNVAIDDLKKAVKTAEDHHESRLAELKALNGDFKAALKEVNAFGKNFDEAIKERSVVEKAHVAAQTAVSTAEVDLGTARSALATAETAVERSANGHKQATAAEEKAADKLAAALKVLSRAEAELDTLKGKLAKAEAVLKKSKDDKGAAKTKAETEKEIRKVEGEVSKAEAVVKQCRADIAAAKEAVKKTADALKAAKGKLTGAEARVDFALEELSAAKKALPGAAAALVQAKKAHAQSEGLVEDSAQRIEDLQAAIPKAKEALQDAHLALADANTALGNRMDVEELFAPIVKLTGRLLTQLDTELGKLEALVPLTPTVAKRLVALQHAVKPHGQTQTALEAARAKTALASKAGNLADLIKDMNSLADDAEKLIKDAPDLRNTFLTKAMEEFYEETVKANLKDFVSAGDIKLPKALKTATDTAAGSGWTAGAIKTAEKDLSDKIKAKIDTLHLAAVEVINVRALGTDNAYRFLTGSIAEANDLARTTGMTVALARQAMNAKLAAQKTPKREKWAAYISRSGINKKSFERTGGGGAYVIHMTILNSNVIAAKPDVNIDTDDVYAAAEKIFGISPSTMQNHVTIEARDGIGGLNKYHLYIGAKKPTGKPDAVQGKALQDAMKWWIDTFFAPVYKRVKDVEGGFHLL